MNLTVLRATDQSALIDPDSILILSYIRLGDRTLPVKYEIPDVDIYQLPYLAHDGKQIRGVSDILTHLRKENFALEQDLDGNEAVEQVALVTTIERRLTPALEWFLWAEDSIFAKFTRHLYFDAIRYPTYFYLPYRWRNRRIKLAKQSQLVNCLREMSETEVGEHLYSIAKLCITSLSYILGQKKYFLGDKPTAVDAYLFARIWPLLLYESKHGTADWMELTKKTSDTIPTASHSLITHLLQCPNLVQFFNRILTKYFPESISDFRSHKSTTADSLMSKHPVRDCILWGSGVVSLFLIYAKWTGNLKLPSWIR